MASAEVLMLRGSAAVSVDMLQAISVAIHQTDKVVKTKRYFGGCDWLVLWGIGAPERNSARKQHIKKGGKVLLFDMGYFGDRNQTVRISINRDHPQEWLDRTTSEAERWQHHGIRLREDVDENGHIVLVGLGRKSRVYLGVGDWEKRKLAELRVRFPNKRIVYRPKPRREYPKLDCETNQDSEIEDVLRGASLVVCRHSNVAVDAVIAGIPFEAEDGAACWLNGKPFTQETRLDLLRRLAHWQYLPSEATQCWQFVKAIV